MSCSAPLAGLVQNFTSQGRHLEQAFPPAVSQTSSVLLTGITSPLHKLAEARKGKPRSSTEVFKYQLWNFSRQASECLTAYTKQNSFSGESEKHLRWYVLQISKECFWEQEHTSGFCSKSRRKEIHTQGVSHPQPDSEGGGCLSALARPANCT